MFEIPKYKGGLVLKNRSGEKLLTELVMLVVILALLNRMLDKLKDDDK
jgi:hypothetical protein